MTDGFLNLADRLEALLRRTAEVRSHRDQAALKVGQLKGALVAAEAELEAWQRAVDDDQRVGEAYGKHLLRLLEQEGAQLPDEPEAVEGDDPERTVRS